ncbi:dehydrogenase [Lithospermum erythrorhizon]|uniref:3-hydroxyisobutyrate dehydrogenase n=1 Tax=Lithospermum erythrorhizon TaxID=34254 RepID=A0AAV3R0K9_LITER
MGSRMAGNLIKAGYSLVIYDVNHNAVNSLSEKGIPSKKSPAEVAESSDVVITMLPSPSHVLDVFTGSKGVLRGGDGIRPKLYIDCSTIDPQTSRKVSKAVSDDYTTKNKGSDAPPTMLDAPVSGGVLAAESGTLTFMVKI